MKNIFDHYSAHELRQIFLDKDNEWPEDFRNWIHEEIANELLDSWLENVDPDIYDEKVKGIIEDLTYGYPDQNGNEMLDFNPKENV